METYYASLWRANMRLEHNVDILTRQMEDAQAAAKTTALQTLIQTALLPDEQALSVAAYYKDWTVGESYLCGDCVNHIGKLYRASTRRLGMRSEPAMRLPASARWRNDARLHWIPQSRRHID